MNEIKMVHSKKYADAVKVAEKFTSKNGPRLFAQMICHREDGSIEATDTYRALIIKDVHGFKEEYLVKVKSLEFAKYDYPKVTTTIPQERKDCIHLNEEQIKIWLQMHRSMNQMSKIPSVDNALHMLMDESGLRFEIPKSEIKFNLPYEDYEHIPETERLVYNIEYMRDALEAHVALESKDAFIQIHGEHRPIVIDNKEDVAAVVLPIRHYVG